MDPTGNCYFIIKKLSSASPMKAMLIILEDKYMYIITFWPSGTLDILVLNLRQQKVVQEVGCGLSQTS